MKTWIYVALGDSTPAGFGVGDDNYVTYFAEYLRQDFKVEVDVYNYGHSGETTSELLDDLQTNNKMRDYIENSDVITIWTGWNDMRSPLSMYQAGLCGGKENLDCIREAVDRLNTNMVAIFDEIRNLCSSNDTRIPPALFNTWVTSGWLDLLRVEAYEAWREHLVKAARSRGITVLQTYRVFNGPDGNEILEGVIQSDGFHFNQKGHILLADLHRQVITGLEKINIPPPTN
jgi:lysophospholipase L1-like esterase